MLKYVGPADKPKGVQLRCESCQYKAKHTWKSIDKVEQSICLAFPKVPKVATRRPQPGKIINGKIDEQGYPVFCRVKPKEQPKAK
jgi:hypothetical protein